MRKFLLPLIALGITASQTHAATVINFGGEMASGVAPIGSASATTIVSPTQFESSVPFSIGTPILPVGGTYSGPAIYGGVYMNALYTSAPAQTKENNWARVANGGVNPDYFEMRRNGPTTNISSSSTTAGALLFDAGGSFTADGTSSLSLTGLSPAGTTDGRWLLVNNGTVYVSQTTIPISNSLTVQTTNTINGATIDSTNWAAWTPGVNLSLSGLTYDVSGSTFVDIEMAGFYFNRTGAIGNNDIRFSSFTADLAVVPEPGTAILAVAGLGLVAMRRRFRKI